MAKLAELVIHIKRYALSQNVSNEIFLNAFLAPLATAGNIRNKKKDDFYLNKTRTSNILNHKADVPQKLRSAIELYRIKDKTADQMKYFIADNLNPERLDELFEDLKQTYQNESFVWEKDYSVHNTEDSLSKVLTELLFVAVSENNKISPEARIILNEGNNYVDVLAGDVFRFGFNNRGKKKNIIVIPVNTTFETHVTRKIEGSLYPLVSENTIHGQWLIRLEKAGQDLESIDERIENSLSNLGIVAHESDAPTVIKNKQYPIGSVAVIEINNAVYFLLAISDFDEFNNAKSSPDEIRSAMVGLLTTYDRIGQGYDLYLPLLGTGMSRSGLSTKEAYNLLINCLIKNKQMISGRIHIVLKQEDRGKIETEEER